MHTKAKILDTSAMGTVQTSDGFFRFVDHARGLLTSGFRYIEGLRRNTGGFREDEKTINTMKRRYADEYGDKEA